MTQTENKENKEIQIKCSNEIQEVLKKYDCGLDVSVVLRENQVMPMLNVVKNPPKDNVEATASSKEEKK